MNNCKKITLLSLCLFIIAIITSACGAGGSSGVCDYFSLPATPETPTITPETPTVIPSAPKHYLTLNKYEFYVEVGKTDNVIAYVDEIENTKDASFSIIEEEPSQAITKETVATVENGLITAYKPGVIFYNVHVDGTEEDQTFKVITYNPKLPTLMSKNIVMGIFDREKLEITLNGEDVTNSDKITYKIEDSSVVTINNGEAEAGLKVSIITVIVYMEGTNPTTFTIEVIDDSTPVPLDNDVHEDLEQRQLIDNKDTATEIIIPPIFKNPDGEKLKIVSIEEKEFANCPELTRVVIPETVKEIKYQAFYNCPKLQEVAIPEGVEFIGEESFKLCPIEEVTIPNTVTTIEDRAFAHNSAVKEIVIPDSVTTIKNGVVCHCDSLEKVTFGSGITVIPEYACVADKSLKEVIMSDDVTEIGPNSFGMQSNIGCTSLKSIQLPRNLKIISWDAFNGSGLEEINLPEGLESIGCNAFSYCKSLKKLIIPDSVTVLNLTGDNKKHIFIRNCDNLEEIQIGNGVTKIEQGKDDSKPTFYDNAKLKKVTFGNGIKSIGIPSANGGNSSIFDKCPNIETIVLGTGLEEINKKAFMNVKFTSINLEIATNLKKIENSAFNGCTAVESITIPNDVGTIESSAFKNVKHIYIIMVLPVVQNGEL